MPAQLRNITTADEYTDAGTVIWPNTKRITLQVANAAVLYQLDESDDGKRAWSRAERFLVPTVGILGRNCSGLRVRSAVPGSPAQVTAELLAATEISETQDQLAPFAEFVSPSGAITGGGAGMQLIEDVLLTGPQTAVTLPSSGLLPATFAHLLILGAARGDVAAVVTTLRVQFNGDGGPSYHHEFEAAAGAAVSAGEGIGVTSMLAGAVAGGMSPAGSYAPVGIELPSYAGSVDKAVIARAGIRQAPTTGNMVLQLSFGVWASLAPITEIVLFPATGSFVAGSRFSLYGLPGG